MCYNHRLVLHCFLDDLVASNLKQSSMLRTKEIDSTSRSRIELLSLAVNVLSLTERLIVEPKKATKITELVWIDNRANGCKNATSLCLYVVHAYNNDDNV